MVTKNLIQLIFSGVILSFFILKPINSEIFTSISSLEDLIEIESSLIANLENYLNSIQNRAQLLQRKVEYYRNEHKKISEDSFRYITNPINSFLIIKRLVRDWKEIKNDVIQDSEDYVKNEIQIKEHSKFPTEEDVEGAAVGLLRLQDLYKLDTKLLTLGIINKFQYSSQLSASDCFEMGRLSLQQKNIQYTLEWLTEASEKLNDEENRNKTDLKVDIYDYLAYTLYLEGDVDKSLELANEILKLNPNHTRTIGNQKSYQKQVEIKRSAKNEPKSEQLPPKNAYIRSPDLEHTQYEMLCRGDLGLSAAEQRPLRCRYIFGAEPFLRIAPFKVQEALHNPFVAIFYDVLTNNEMEIFKKFATQKLARSRVGNKNSTITKIRISKSSILEDSQHKVIDNMALRTQDMTNLSRISFERTQVANYGIGGYYYKHLDCSNRKENISDSELPSNDRIATVLYYLSDVEEGGATVFPRLKLAVRPKKGSALFWYNLHASGVPDIRTLHAGCPVLIGSKWIINKWIHEFGQEFRRPCNLYPDHPKEY